MFGWIALHKTKDRRSIDNVTQIITDKYINREDSYTWLLALQSCQLGYLPKRTVTSHYYNTEVGGRRNTISAERDSEAKVSAEQEIKQLNLH